MKNKKFRIVIVALILIVAGICLFVGGLIWAGGIKAVKETFFQQDIDGFDFDFDYDFDVDDKGGFLT